MELEAGEVEHGARTERAEVYEDHHPHVVIMVGSVDAAVVVLVFKLHAQG